MKLIFYKNKILVCTFILIFLHIKLFSQNHSDSCSFACSIDINKDELFYNEVSLSDFQKQVVPSIFAINLEDVRAYLNFRIPFDTLSQAVGLNLIFGKLLPTCCDCNSNQICGQDFYFHKILGTSCATFTWDSKSSTPIVKDIVIDHLRFHISIAKKLTGKAKISPNYLKLEFYENLIRFSVYDLSKIIDNKPKVIIDYWVKGIESTAWKGILYPPCIRPFKSPNLPIYLQPK